MSLLLFQEPIPITITITITITYYYSSSSSSSSYCYYHYHHYSYYHCPRSCPRCQLNMFRLRFPGAGFLGAPPISLTGYTHVLIAFLISLSL